ncbi:SRGAP1 [Cordylochernes scorpioides]|uniref:SRGAP1 n=1 Tax=Cordylochernes scorpioides TaxID=51811 RepID=A0ABY6KZA6_9ARAC|nr:SRGAP1 [Cordylochernes scorpioides]
MPQESDTPKRCYKCPSKNAGKVKTLCSVCQLSVCKKHFLIICENCLKFVLEYDTGAAQIWKTLETAEHSLLAMMSAPEIDVSAMFDEEPPARPPETLALKKLESPLQFRRRPLRCLYLWVKSEQRRTSQRRRLANILVPRAGFKLQDLSYKIQATRFKLQDLSYKS